MHQAARRLRRQAERLSDRRRPIGTRSSWRPLHVPRRSGARPRGRRPRSPCPRTAGRTVRVADPVEAVTDVWCQPHPASSDLREAVRVLDVTDVVAARRRRSPAAGRPAMRDASRSRSEIVAARVGRRQVLPAWVDPVEEEDTGEEREHDQGLHEAAPHLARRRDRGRRHVERNGALGVLDRRQLVATGAERLELLPGAGSATRRSPHPPSHRDGARAPPRRHGRSASGSPSRTPPDREAAARDRQRQSPVAGPAAGRRRRTAPRRPPRRGTAGAAAATPATSRSRGTRRRSHRAAGARARGAGCAWRPSCRPATRRRRCLAPAVPGTDASRRTCPRDSPRDTSEAHETTDRRVPCRDAVFAQVTCGDYR